MVLPNKSHPNTVIRLFSDAESTNCLTYISILGKVCLGRSEIRSVADERVKGLNKYCADILNLDKKISQSIFVKQFVDVRPDDIDPPKDTV